MRDRHEFNLVEEPWIRVLDTQGRTSEVSLIGLFEGADTYRALAGDLPTQDVALLRICLAVLHRALEAFAPDHQDFVPGRLDQVARQWNEVALPEVRQYLTEHSARFDLLHPTAPFFQVAGMRTAKGDVTALSKLIADMPDGRPYLTMRSAAAARRITPAEAARWLVHLHAYDPSGIKTGVVGHPRAKGGKVYPEGTGWSGQLGLLHLVGDTLLHTLLLNLWAVLPEPEVRAVDLPPWERPPDSLDADPDLVDRPSGPVDLYTWQPRRALLFGDRAGITGLLISYGDRFIVQERQGVVNLEPMSLWRYSKPQSAKYKHAIQMPSKHRPGVALWRGLASIVPRDVRREDESTKNPVPAAPSRLVRHASAISETALLRGRMVRYRAVGVQYGSNESVIDEVIDDEIDLPALVLAPEQAELRRAALDAVEAAQLGAVTLARFARGIARASGAGKDEAEGPADRAFESAFAALDSPYRDWLRDSLAHSSANPLAAESQWHVTARALILRLGEELASAAPDKAWRGFGAQGRRQDVGTEYEFFLSAVRRAFPRAQASPASGDVTRQDTTVTPEGDE